MNVTIGTSGFSYPKWKGKFYPEKLPNAKMLSYYATQFGGVELNNTFYRMPTEKALASWRDEVPEPFRFAIKSPQQITHKQRLVDSGDTVAHLVKLLGTLGEKCGPILFQLPPFMKKDVERLKSFLALLPKGTRAAFEFRHLSWFEADVFDALKSSGAALCIAEGEKIVTPMEATADWGYLRLRRTDYTEKDLAAWAEKLRAQKWRDAFVFFKHEDEPTGPAFAVQFTLLLR